MTTTCTNRWNESLLSALRFLRSLPHSHPIYGIKYSLAKHSLLAKRLEPLPEPVKPSECAFAFVVSTVCDCSQELKQEAQES